MSSVSRLLNTEDFINTLTKRKCQQKLQKFKIFNNQMPTKTGTTEFMLSNIKNTIPQQLGPI